MRAKRDLLDRFDDIFEGACKKALFAVEYLAEKGH